MWDKSKYNVYYEYLTCRRNLADLSDTAIHSLYEQLLTVLPNNGKLYKYRGFNMPNSPFEYAYKALKEGYLWLAPAADMNDELDTTLNISSEKTCQELIKFFKENPLVFIKFFLQNALAKNNIVIPFSDQEFMELYHCYTKKGKLVKRRLSNLMMKYHIPYNKTLPLLNKLVSCLEELEQNLPQFAKSYATYFLETNSNIRAKSRLYCMSESHDLDNMWAYYADSNKGYCIEYDFNKGLLFDVTIKKVLLSLFKIKYHANKPQFSYINIVKYILSNSNNKNYEVLINRSIYEQLLIKNRHWKNELEWRILTISTGKENDINENKLPVDLVSSLYINECMLNTENARLLISLGKERGWNIYVRSINSLHTKHEYYPL